MQSILRKGRGWMVAMCLGAAMGCWAAENTRVYVGTYTGSKSKGIYMLELNTAAGTLGPAVLAAETPSPSFLAIHPKGTHLYAANEVGEFQGQKTGAISAFAIDAASGQLRLLNQSASGGTGPCHLVMDKTGRHVLVANYGGGSVAVLPVDKEGRLGPATAVVNHSGSSVNPGRQEAPHAHSINLDSKNRFAFAADLGLDQVLIYRFDPERGTLTAHNPAFVAVHAGAGPRHFAIHPTDEYAYVINELHSTVTAFALDAKQGRLTSLQTLSTVPTDVGANNSTAEVQVHPTGKFLYGSNRGHDSIAVFGIDPKSGRLHPVENRATQGKTPRNFGIDPTGKYLLAANQGSHTLVMFRIDPQTGALSATDQKVEVPTPVCVKFLKH